MRTKKMCAALAAMVLVTAMVIGCVMPPIEATDDYTPPAGMGVIRVNFDSEIARATILPEGGDIGDFLEFEITFTADATTPAGATTKTVHQTKATGTGAAVMNTAIELDAGNYSGMTVIGYLVAGTGDRDTNGVPDLLSVGTAGVMPTKAAATATIADGGIKNGSGTTPIDGTGMLVVANGGNSPVSVTLHAFDPDGLYTPAKTGTFAWDITDSLSGTLTAPSTMSITQLDSTDVGGSPISLLVTGNWNDSVDLPAGIYHVNFTLQMGSGVGAVIRTFRHVLHIYENLTSTFVYEFTDLHIAIVSTRVTPTITYVDPPDYSPIVAVTGGTATHTGTGHYDTTTHVIDALKVNITPTGTVIIKVTNAADVDGDTNAYDTITWQYAGGAIPGTALSDTLTSGADDTLTLSTAAAPFNTVTVGTAYQLAVTGEFDGKEYTTEIYIQIVAP